MKTVAFVLLIIGSVLYLFVGNGVVSSWVSDKSPTGQVEKLQDALNEQVERHVSEQMKSQLGDLFNQHFDEGFNKKFKLQTDEFKGELEQQQQQQVAALQKTVVNMAQKMAKLEGQLSQLEAQLQSQPAAVTTTVANNNHASGVEVGVVKRGNEFDYSASTSTSASNQSASATNNVNHSANQAVEHYSMPSAVTGSVASNTSKMDKAQRRARLQELSERMTLQSLGVER